MPTKPKRKSNKLTDSANTISSYYIYDLYRPTSTQASGFINTDWTTYWTTSEKPKKKYKNKHQW